MSFIFIQGILIEQDHLKSPWLDKYSCDCHMHFESLVTEQDQGLEALSRVVGRQKQMAIDIGNEVDSQNGKCL